MHVLLLLLVYLHEAVVPHDTLIETTGCQSICSDQIKHVFILEFAHGGLCVAKNIGRPWFIEQELLYAEDGAFCVDLVVLNTFHTEANEFATCNKEHGFVPAALPDHLLTSLKLYCAHGLHDEPLITLLDSLEEGPH